MILIAIADEQSLLPLTHTRHRKAIRTILQDAGHRDARISLAIVDDDTIHDLNRQFLGHDYPTDAITFVLSDEADERLEGEIVVSAQMATSRATEFGWSAEDELLLYVIHGALHLVGFDDTTAAAAKRMRTQEQHYLRLMGVTEDPMRRPDRGKPASRTPLRTGKANR